MRVDVEGCHIQSLRRLLIRPQQPQLVDLVGFVEMRRHDPVAFPDPTSKHSDVGHHSSVVVEIGVKHQGFERVSSARLRPVTTRLKEKNEKKNPDFSGVHGACEKKRKREKKALTVEFYPLRLAEPFQRLCRVLLISVKNEVVHLEKCLRCVFLKKTP